MVCNKIHKMDLNLLRILITLLGHRQIGGLNPNPVQGELEGGINWLHNFRLGVTRMT